MSDESPSGGGGGGGSGSDKKGRGQGHDENDDTGENENKPDPTAESQSKSQSQNQTPTGSRSRVRFNDEEISSKSSEGRERENKMRKEGARERRPTPYPKNRRVKPRLSCEDTMLQQNPTNSAGIGTDVDEVSKAPQYKKSQSLDAMGNLSTLPSSDDLLSTYLAYNQNQVLKALGGASFPTNKVGPAQPEEFIVAPVTVTVGPTPTESQQRCTQAQVQMQQSSSKGEVCIHLTKSNDSLDNICRICHDSPSSEKLIKPCLCKGSMGTVHRTCLERWLGESGKGACEICGQEFNTVRVPKHKGIRSIIAWIRNPINRADSRNFFFDLACFFILTPLACLSAWLCVVGAQNYAFDQSKTHSKHRARGNETAEVRAQRDASNSTWTSIGLLSLTGTLVAAYYIWIFVAFRYHLQVWREWQQRNYIVTIVPMANGDFCHPPAPAPPPPTSRNRQGTEDAQNHNQNQPGEIRDRDRRQESERDRERDRSRSLSPLRNGGQHQIRTLNNNISQGHLFEQAFLARGVDSSCGLDLGLGLNINASDSDMALIQQALMESFESSQPQSQSQPKVISVIHSRSGLSGVGGGTDTVCGSGSGSGCRDLKDETGSSPRSRTNLNVNIASNDPNDHNTTNHNQDQNQNENQVTVKNSSHHDFYV